MYVLTDKPIYGGGGGGGGLIFYIRDDLEWEHFGPKFSSTDIESFSILLKRKHQKNLWISIVYLPPKANFTLAIGGQQRHHGCILAK